MNPQSDEQRKIDEDWNREIARRIEELKSGKVKGIPLDEVKRRIEKKFGFQRRKK